MSDRLLTIIVPTYNRATNLSLLLSTLTQELVGLEKYVRVIVGDNASTDDTASVTKAFKEGYPEATILRHLDNLGAEENFCRCVDRVESRYFWIIGDDDLPKRGTLLKIITILNQEVLDLLYIKSEWLPNIINSEAGEKIAVVGDKRVSRQRFAADVNVWITFISGMVVNLDRLRKLDSKFDSRRFLGTSLVQLGWVLPLLMRGDSFGIVTQRCILATSGNTGGYNLFGVFGNFFPKILTEICGRKSREYKLIMAQLCWIYIPKLVWASRFFSIGAFDSEKILEAVHPLRTTMAYWMVIVPLSFFNKFFSYPFIYFVGFLEKILYFKNKIIF